MKKLIVLAAVLFTSVTSIFAQSADEIKGVWISKSKEVKIEIYKAGDKYYGKIIWANGIYESDGKTLKKDDNNSNASLRYRSILNLVILSGYSYDDGEWTGGELYDPKSGKTYDSNMKIKGGNLEIRGYVGSPMFGKTTTWTRA